MVRNRSCPAVSHCWREEGASQRSEARRRGFVVEIGHGVRRQPVGYELCVMYRPLSLRCGSGGFVPRVDNHRRFNDATRPVPSSATS